MIRIERGPAADAEAALQRLGRNGLTESEHALWFFGGIEPVRPGLPPAPTKAPKFSVYKSEAVKEALEALFGTRCAYCESPYAHTNSMEVEHFRPKGGYIDDDGRRCAPGYYWLAATYDNLLPSCVDCNRERKQFHRLKNGERVLRKSGKANRFPISPGTPRATCQAELVNECPLLLNPCTDQPTDHLRFLSNGFVEPIQSPQEAIAPKGQTTIDVYGLVREALVGERHSWSKRMQSEMQKVLSAERNRRRHPDDEEMEAQLAAAQVELDSFLNLGSKYLALTRAMASTFARLKPVAIDYLFARSAWITSRSAEHRAELVACTARVQELLSDPSLDHDLINRLIEPTGVLA
ncbi:hypothetical protein [Rhizobium sp. NXC24]|uniref:hypothetical protein n=1 Tax=Rhizobium sp. NXC24 TaxID=2048897 RepID=UPI000CDF3AEB|nr:hypothetical protein [Rhizobium sp. NXC24]AVA21303.1 hypothetical protein NXC24_CH01652 [Rhizobium sp. NXC24]